MPIPLMILSLCLLGLVCWVWATRPFRHEPVRLLVCGDRYWDNYDAVADHIFHIKPDIVISGEAPGADTHAKQAAEAFGIDYLGFPAQWNRFGRAAGPIRNQKMLEVGKPTRAVAFHANLAESKGTADMVKRLKKAKIPYEVVES